MGVLRDDHSGQSYTLSARTLVGRGRGCDLTVADALVSSEHATVFWSTEGWVVRDLASRNGTSLDGERLEPGRDVLLRAGSRLAIGGADNLLTPGDAGPPFPMARRERDGALRAASGDLLALPDDDNPEATVLRGGEGGWSLEMGEQARPVADQDVVVIDDEAWRLHLPTVSAGATISGVTGGLVDPPITVVDVGLRLTVSKDEESVRLQVVLPEGATHDIPPRSWQFLLLHLARSRLSDQGTLGPAEQGWVYVDDVLAGLGMSLGTLRLHVHRARQTLLDLGVEDASALIERRTQAGQLRLGTGRIEVCRSE